MLSRVRIPKTLGSAAFPYRKGAADSDGRCFAYGGLRPGASFRKRAGPLSPGRVAVRGRGTDGVLPSARTSAQPAAVR